MMLEFDLDLAVDLVDKVGLLFGHIFNLIWWAFAHNREVHFAAISSIFQRTIK